MPSSRTTIQHKLMRILLLISAVVAVLTCGTLVIYDAVSFRQQSARELNSLGAVIAANSTAALAFDNAADAAVVLASVAADQRILAAGLYQTNDALFSSYSSADDAALPASPGPDGLRFDPPHLVSVQPVQFEDRRLGTLYLRSDMAPIYARLTWHITLVLVVVATALAVAYVLARTLQRQISRPIVALADTARTVSRDGNFSLRAIRHRDDELGDLTDTFNEMLSGLQARDHALRENETRLQTIVENLTEGLIIFDLNGRLLQLNRAALDLHGFAATAEAGTTLAELVEKFALADVDGNVLPAAARPIARILAGETLHGIELRVRRLVEPRWERFFSYGGTQVPDPEGRPALGFITLRDITARKQGEAEIHQLNAELEDRVTARTAELQTANRELEAFSYSVSHDLRAPLRHIDGFTQMLQKRVGATLDDTARRYLDTISASAKRLGVLIDELLVFSRMGRVDLQQQPVDCRALVETVRQELALDIDGRRITWEVGDLPEVSADPTMLRQVWANLLGNAVKYTRDRDPAVISVSHHTDPDQGDVFAVRDNGAGFEMQYAHKLFGVFQRLHRDSEFEGTGIGLANVRRMVQRHHGTVGAEGRPGEGATFWFSLPRAPGASLRAGDDLRPSDL